MELRSIFGKSLKILFHFPVLLIPALGTMAVLFLLSVATIGGSPVFGNVGGRVLSDGLGAEVVGFGRGLFMLSIFGLFLAYLAHGLTVVMADELLRTGTTSFGAIRGLLVHRTVDVILLTLIVGLGVGLGLRLLIVPGLLAAFAFLFAYPLVLEEDVGAVGAVRRSVALVMESPDYAAGFFGMLLLVQIVAWILGELCRLVPFVGTFLSLVVTGLAGAFMGCAVLLGYRSLQETLAESDDGVSEGIESDSPESP